MSPAAQHRARRREEIISRMRRHLAEHPPAADRVILFGSLARGDWDGASDADLLVIGGGILDSGIITAAGRECDMLAWSQAEWESARRDAHPLAIAAERDGVELWRRPVA